MGPIGVSICWVLLFSIRDSLGVDDGVFSRSPWLRLCCRANIFQVLVRGGVEIGTITDFGGEDSLILIFDDHKSGKYL
jgi:hypothetical protein